MNPDLLEAQIKTTRELRRERLNFMKDRLGHNGHTGSSLGRITYLAHAKGYVMARRPGAVPFVIAEDMWRSFPFWDAGVHSL